MSRRRRNIAMILGGASCVWDDVLALEEMLGRRWDGVIVCVNDVGAHWPRRLDHWFTLHPERLARWKRLREAHGFPGKYVTWGRRSRVCDRIVKQPPVGGSSSLLAVQGVRAELRIPKAVLCGVPMNDAPHFEETNEHAPGKAWDSKSHWKAWERAHAMLLEDGWLRSMSASTPELTSRTREMLGPPNLEWLEEGL